MNQFLVLLSVVAAAFGAIRNHVDKDMLRSNRVPKPGADDGIKTETKIDLCPECELTVQGIVDILKNPNDVELIKKYLTDVCPYLTWFLNKTECESLIKDNFITLLHQLIPALENKRKVCQELHMCDTDDAPGFFYKTVFNIAKIHLKAVKSGTGLDGAVCDDCQFVINELHSVLGDKELQGKIKAYMEQACSYLQTFKDECTALIDQYFPIIVEKIEQYLGDPKKLCKEIGLCSASTNKIPLTKILSPQDAASQMSARRNAPSSLRNVQMDAQILPRLQTKDGTTASCIVCVSVFRLMIDELERSNATQWAVIDDIKTALDAVLPEDVAKQVDSFLDLYGEQGLTMLLEHLSSTRICEDLHVCTRFESNFIIRQGATAFKGMQCETCEGVLMFVKSELQNPETQAEFVELFQMFCRYMPTSDQQECKNEMKIFVPQAMQVAGQDINPKGVCSAMSLC